MIFADSLIFSAACCPKFFCYIFLAHLPDLLQKKTILAILLTALSSFPTAYLRKVPQKIKLDRVICY